MAIAGIGGAFRMYIPISSAAKTTKTGDEAEFSKGVHVVSAGAQDTMLCYNALMSYASP